MLVCVDSAKYIWIDWTDKYIYIYIYIYKNVATSCTMLKMKALKTLWIYIELIKYIMSTKHFYNINLL